MRGKDEDTGAFLAPSRSQQRREALDVLALAHQLVTLDPGRLAQLPVPEDLLGHIADTRRVGSNIARKRQMAFLAKQMRREDDAALDAIRDALDAGGEAARQETALLHRVEAWRDRLIADGDDALAAFLVEFPGGDRQRLRQLARNVVEERRRNKPPHAFRELFRALREAMADATDADADNGGGIDRSVEDAAARPDPAGDE